MAKKTYISSDNKWQPSMKQAGMDYLNWDLDVLSRAIIYTNLSGAAQHIGISQPQLSRIVSKLEERYGIVLLNRESKRKSTWTHDAFSLVENYKQVCHQFQGAVNQINEQAVPKKIMIASLEGMTIFAVQLAKFAFKTLGITEVTIDILDLNKIEEYFLKNRYDFILSQRTPGRTKYEYVKEIGFQTIDFNLSKNEDTLVLSSFEKSSTKTKKQTPQNILVSNSLHVRNLWFKKYGGCGSLPSQVRSNKLKNKENFEVLLVGQPSLSKKFWKEVLKFKPQSIAES